jgi:hypothetical protein
LTRSVDIILLQHFQNFDLMYWTWISISYTRSASSLTSVPRMKGERSDEEGSLSSPSTPLYPFLLVLFIAGFRCRVSSSTLLVPTTQVIPSEHCSLPPQSRKGIKFTVSSFPPPSSRPLSSKNSEVAITLLHPLITSDPTASAFPGTSFASSR